MNQGKYIFSQIMEFVPYYQFNQCVKKYNGHYYVKSFSCWEQFLSMVFGQLTYRESLRDIVTCLRAQQEKLHHLGFSSLIARTTLAGANEKRDWRIYRDLAELLIQQARQLYCNDKKFNLDLGGSCYIIDSTTIELCLNIFKWARLIETRASIKLHLQLDLNSDIPAFFDITGGKIHDLSFLDMIELETGAYYIMDRGYTDFKRLFKIQCSGAFFIVRAKKDFAFKRLYSNKVDKSNGLRCDQVINLTHHLSSRKYSDKLRRIKYFDEEGNRHFVFLTNDFNLEAQTVADLYKHRWQIELFFKWIKQHLKIKCFWGYSANAVKTQICIAICVYLLVAIIRKKLNINRNLYEILQILSVSAFDKSPLNRLISEVELSDIEAISQKQAKLWGF